MLAFIPASATPNRTTSRAGMPRRSRIAGRQIATSTIAANTTRRSTMPTGPASSNRVFATALPTCTETIDPRTSVIAGALPLSLTPRTVRSGAVRNSAAAALRARSEPSCLLAPELADRRPTLDQLPQQRAPRRLRAQGGGDLEQQPLHPAQQQRLRGQGHPAHLLHHLIPGA